VVPCFGEDAGRFEQHTKNGQRRIDLHGELRLDPEALGAVAVPLLDAALGVVFVAAHVPFPGRARNARLGVGPAHDADNEIARRKTATIGSGLDPAERFVAEHEALLARGSGPVKPRQDVPIRPAHAQRQRARQNRAVRQRRFGNVVDAGGIGNAGRDGERAHSFAG
jgi:hypothetical protein